jgi:hypothetical protein
MNMCATSRNRLRRGLLYLARVLWILFALSNLMSLPFGIQAYYSQIFATGRRVPAVARALSQMHLTAAQAAVAFIVIFGLASLVFLVIGALIFWRLWGTSRERLGLLTSFIFITIGFTGITGVFEGETVSSNPFLQLAFIISGMSFFVLFPCLAAFLLTFPDGRFVPRWSWLLILLWLGQFAFFMVSTTGILAISHLLSPRADQASLLTFSSRCGRGGSRIYLTKQKSWQDHLENERCGSLLASRAI